MDLIGEKLSLKAQFGHKWKDWNLRGPDLIFPNSIGWNHG